jgi:hypothetical protein
MFLIVLLFLFFNLFNFNANIAEKMRNIFFTSYSLFNLNYLILIIIVLILNIFFSLKRDLELFQMIKHLKISFIKI